MPSQINLPRLYPILDAAAFLRAADPGRAIAAFAEELMQGGATLLQYRNKSEDVRSALDYLRRLMEVTRGRARLIVNDRVDLCLAVDAGGIHLGQDDLPPAVARRVLEMGGAAERWLGFSTHNPGQIKDANPLPVDYLAIGPVFTTTSKTNPDPTVGLQGVREARKATERPLVAIGGITRANCRSVVEAGADCVAIISDLVESPRAAVQDFLRLLR